MDDSFFDFIKSKEFIWKRVLGIFENRKVTMNERAVIRKIFGDKLNVDEIRIFDQTPLPDLIDDIGNKLNSAPPRPPDHHNAITLGNFILFGRSIDTTKPHDMGWFLHEVTHVWQYQTMGWDYLKIAMNEQATAGRAAYDYGAEDGLRRRRSNGENFRNFKLEQQGDVVKNYYRAMEDGKDTSPYEDFIQDLRKEEIKYW